MQATRDPRDADQYYEQALRLAQERLEVSTGDDTARARIAGYLARLGRDAAARDMLEILWQAEDLSLETIREIGMAYLFLGDRARAVEQLAAASAAGLPAWLLTADKRLEPLAELPEFQALLADNTQRP
jgi:tetratricopeptide (TPR) repeat protein